MENSIEKLSKLIEQSFTTKNLAWTDEVYSSQQYQQEIRFLQTVSMEFIHTVRAISFYSTRNENIYREFLSIRTIDDLIQSSIGIKLMVENGIYNIAKRELRYLIEMITKYVIVDYLKMGESFESKTEYLRDKVPRSSIEIINEYSTPFSDNLKDEF